MQKYKNVISKEIVKQISYMSGKQNSKHKTASDKNSEGLNLMLSPLNFFTLVQISD